jgi:hypothetical protein
MTHVIVDQMLESKASALDATFLVSLGESKTELSIEDNDFQSSIISTFTMWPGNPRF